MDSSTWFGVVEDSSRSRFVHSRFKNSKLSSRLLTTSGFFRDTCSSNTTRERFDSRDDIHFPASDSNIKLRARGWTERFETSIKNAEDDPNYERDNFEFDELKKNFRALQEENFKLQAVITDVTEVNKRWQKYNNDRQMYVQKLLSTIQDQQEQMNRIIGEKSLYSKDNLKDDEAASKTHQFEEEIRHLRERLERQEREHKEHIAVLEYQLKAHRDDWEAEHNEKEQTLKDKAAIETKLQELEKELRTVRLKLQNVSSNHICSNCQRILAAQSEEHDSSHITNVISKCGLSESSKTYRSSVQLPNTLGAKQRSLFFDSDLTTDGSSRHGVHFEPEAKCGKLKDFSHSEPIITSDRAPQHKTDLLRDTYSLLDVTQPSTSTSTSETQNLNSREGVKYSGLRSRMAKLNIQPGDSAGSNQTFGSSVLRLPTVGNVTVASEAEDSIKDGRSNVAATGGVSIGFSSDGLASVTAFPRKRIIKSMSLPTPDEPDEEDTPTTICNSASDDIARVASRGSAGKTWSDLSIVGPPVSEDSCFKISKKELLPYSSALGKTENHSHQHRPSNKANYYEEGVATQTEEDVICPGCGQVFPPKLHLMFLDHFEMCQNASSR